KRAAVRAAVHRFISRLLEGQDDFDDNASLAQLGLDKQDIEELIFHLEDELGLTAFTAEEDRMLKDARTANDLSRFLVEIG
ncbi:phosphopantetheine-containing protein, partial [Pseudomonas sp. GW247-3R2A]